MNAQHTPITHAMIFAAGLGTRLKPFTNHHPKALAVVNGKSLLQRNIEYLQQFGISHVVVNVHHFADQIVQAVEDNHGWGSTVYISDETEAVLETGGGLKKAANFFETTPHFVVMNADMLTNLSLHHMMQAHLQSHALATLAVTVRNSSRYFLFDTAQRLCGWQNVQTQAERIVLPHQPLQAMAFSGIHVVSNRLLPLMQQQGKFSMVDVYLALAAKEQILAYNHTGDILIDVGKPENLEKAESLFP